MAIKEFLDTEHVFNRDEFNAAFPGSSTDANLLARAVKAGKVERVRHGLYVSKTDRFRHMQPSPLDIATKAAPDAIFCNLSALQLHGASHDLTSCTQFYTKRRIPNFEHGGQEYRSLILPSGGVDSQKLLLQSGKSYRVTGREQTVVDALSRVSLAGGSEHALRSIASLTYLDTGKVAMLAAGTNQSACARIGWVLENMRHKWDVSDGVLAQLRECIASGPYYFYSSSEPRDSYWAGRWKLLLPYPEKEMVSWLTA